MNTNLTGLANLTDHEVIAAIKDIHATHQTQEWRPEWSATQTTENLIATMGDIDPTDIDDLAVLIVLADPARAMDLARRVDHDRNA
jgi:hypothetical protein